MATSESVDGFYSMQRSRERIAANGETWHERIPSNVFINMNTNSTAVPIDVAEVEEVARSNMVISPSEHKIEDYIDLPNIVLATSALRQGKPPNERGAWDMKTRVMIEQWQATKKALGRMAQFLSSQGIIDRSRLPTASVLPVIAGLYFDIPESGDSSGRGEQLLRKYL